MRRSRPKTRCESHVRFYDTKDIMARVLIPRSCGHSPTPHINVVLVFGRVCRICIVAKDTAVVTKLVFKTHREEGRLC